MKDFKQFFKDKKVTVMGLGLLGKRLGDIAFLVECGAKVLVTDLKTAEELAPSIKKLRKYNLPRLGKAGNIQYVLGGHRLEDFEDKDFILKGQGVALDSPYILHARSRGIPIEMDESLFAKLAPKVKIIGITGTRGKSTTTILIYEILSAFAKASARQRKFGNVYLGGNIRGTAALPLLKKVKDGDFVVFELSSWQLQGFGEALISPHISVFTNFMSDHMNYYGSTTLTTGKAMERYFADKAYIYKFQNENDFLILGPNMKDKIEDAKSRTINADISTIPVNWKIKLPGKHNLENIACALEVAKLLEIPEKIVKKVIENFKAIEGRLELVKDIRGIKIYNDTNSTTPEATITALYSFGTKVILIMGGMDKGLGVSDLNEVLPDKTKNIFLIPGSGSDKINNPKIKIEKVASLEEAISSAMKIAKRGDVILFSPSFASFNMFKNEYDRGEKFMQIVKNLK
ncbi:MAG: UDP-N-acetylmuramoyl-L-alanine--D-glutamate ligase [Candidatus Paceibacterota bacterium]|jgi:UDP-N-acetylmuramoylalanine--D-glutamate ligase